MLHWVQIAIIVSLRNRTVERGGRQNACVAKVTGFCVVVIFTKYQCFSVFYKKICLKEDEVWGNFFSNKIIVTLVRQGLPFSLLARPVTYSHTKMAATVKNLTFTDEELPLHVLVGYKQKRKAKALIGRLWKQSGMSSTKSLSKNITKTFRKSFCKESANNRNNNISDIELFLQSKAQIGRSTYVTYQRRITRLPVFTQQTVQKLARLTRARVKVEPFGHQFWLSSNSDLVKNLHTLPFKNFHGSAVPV